MECNHTENNILNPFGDIYTSLNEAKEEIHKRWNDERLRKEVEKYIGEIPEPLRSEPKAVLFRNIMTPNNEFSHFLKTCEEIQLKSIGLEFHKDRFCTRSADKVVLGRLLFRNRQNGNGDSAFHYRRIVDMPGSDNRHFADLQTKWGENLIDFHHKLLAVDSKSIELFDMSLWIKARGGKASEYYQYFLALFICTGILFENFVTNEYEQEFAENVVYPAINKIQKEFALKPLIVPLFPLEQSLTKYWWCYPEIVEKEILSRGTLAL